MVVIKILGDSLKFRTSYARLLVLFGVGAGKLLHQEKPKILIIQSGLYLIMLHKRGTGTYTEHKCLCVLESLALKVSLRTACTFSNLSTDMELGTCSFPSLLSKGSYKSLLWKWSYKSLLN